MEHWQEDLAESDREAREYVTRLLGKEPEGNPILKGMAAFAFSAIVPWLGLPLLGVPMTMIETPLLVIGLICGFSVWWYHKSSSQVVEGLDATDGGKGSRLDEPKESH